MSVSPAVEAPATWLNVFLFFLKIGSVLYGSGYVLLALQGSWWNETSGSPQQLLDAVAIGQFTPGPVFTTLHYLSASGQCWGACRGGICPLLFWWA